MSQIIKIRVLPRSSKNEIVGEMADGTFKIKLKAPPVEGRANEALIELLSEEYAVPKSGIKIIKGLTSKNKIIRIE